IVLVDLVERRIARAAEIAAIALPFAGRRAVGGGRQPLLLRQSGHAGRHRKRRDSRGGEQEISTMQVHGKYPPLSPYPASVGRHSTLTARDFRSHFRDQLLAMGYGRKG